MMINFHEALKCSPSISDPHKNWFKEMLLPISNIRSEFTLTLFGRIASQTRLEPLLDFLAAWLALLGSSTVLS